MRHRRYRRLHRPCVIDGIGFGVISDRQMPDPEVVPVSPEPSRPYCPKCNGKPSSGQRKLTEMERDKLTGQTWKVIDARFDAAYICKACSAIYIYQQGFSTYVTRVHKSG